MESMKAKSRIFLKDHVYGTLCRADGEYSPDYPPVRDNPMEFCVVAADASVSWRKRADMSPDSSRQSGSIPACRSAVSAPSRNV